VNGIIIDELSNVTLPVQSGDEFPIERGQAMYKVDYDDLIGNNLSAINDDISDLQTDVNGLQSNVTKAQTSINALESGIAIIVNGNSAAQTVPSGGYAYLKNNQYGLAEGLYININSADFPTGSSVAATSSYFSAVSGGGLNRILATNIIRYGSVGMDEMSDITIAGSAGRYKDITFDGFTSPPCVLATFRNDNISTYGNLTIAVSSVTKTSARLLVPYPLNASNAGVYWMAIGQ